MVSSSLCFGDRSTLERQPCGTLEMGERTYCVLEGLEVEGWFLGNASLSPFLFSQPWLLVVLSQPVEGLATNYWQRYMNEIFFPLLWQVRENGGSK